MDTASLTLNVGFSRGCGSVKGVPTHRWLDADGIVFCANYLKFFESARTKWLRYLKPARLDDELLVTAQPLEIGRASLTIGQRAIVQRAMRQGPDGPVLLCEGSIRIGWVDAAHYRPMRIPPTVLEALT